MASTRPAAPSRFRWDQILVLAVVVVATDFVGVWWLTRDAPAAGIIQAQAQGDVGPPTPDAGMFDDEMSRAVRRAALQRGTNPTELAELPQLWFQVCSDEPSACDIDVTDRAAVQAAFETHLRGQRRSSSTSGGDRGRPGGGAARAGAGAGAGGRSTAGGRGSMYLQPSMVRLDELQALRLDKLAQQHSIDPAVVMPSDALRQAALASDDPRSQASLNLLDAYRSALMALSDEPDDGN